MSVQSIESSRDALSGRPATEILSEMSDALRDVKSCVVTAHIAPDGDALGSCVGLVLGLRQIGKAATAVFTDELPDRYRELLPHGVVERVTPEELAKRSVDWFVVLDTSEPERIGTLQPVFFADGVKRMCLDHHQTYKSGRYQHELIITEAPATGRLVLAFLETLGVTLTPEIAHALWIAIATDTGWFRFSNTGEWALRDASRLVSHGIEVESLHDQLYHDLSLPRARLVGHVLKNACTEHGGKLLWSFLSLEDRGSVSLRELDGVIDYLKAIREAQIIAVIVQTGPDSFKISLRARGEANVERIARSFGGGGHVKAAGCRFAGTLDELGELLRSRTGEQLLGP